MNPSKPFLHEMINTECSLRKTMINKAYLFLQSYVQGEFCTEKTG
jgi:hypothetical protein